MSKQITKTFNITISITGPAEMFRSNEDILKADIACLELTQRSETELRKQGINTVGQLVSKTKEQLVFPGSGIGKKSHNEIVDALFQEGLALRVDNGEV